MSKKIGSFWFVHMPCFSNIKLGDGVNAQPCLLSCVFGSIQAIPTAWVSKHQLKENADVILRINKRTWKTRYYYHRSRNSGGLSGGWRSFVNDNNIKEHDVCVFEPANTERKPIVLDVSIFHVLQSPVPLSQVNPALF